MFVTFDWNKLSRRFNRVLSSIVVLIERWKTILEITTDRKAIPEGIRRWFLESIVDRKLCIWHPSCWESCLTTNACFGCYYRSRSQRCNINSYYSRPCWNGVSRQPIIVWTLEAKLWNTELTFLILYQMLKFRNREILERGKNKI